LIDAAALPGVGCVRLRAALSDPLAPAAALNRLSADVRGGLGVVDRERAGGWARRALETIVAGRIHVLVPGDGYYPERLLHLSDPPCPLFARGRLELLETPMVAVVGTRRCTPYGRDAARRIATGLAAAGVTVVSGLARGIDGEAHAAAGPARTAAVLGCGIDVVFPVDHRSLQESIGIEGLLVTEQLPGSPPAAHNFPRRNRIIAGLALGVVVIEAPVKSGALSTARKAADGGQDVFAVPGPIGTRSSAGTNALIRDGARLVTSAREVLQRLRLPLPPEGCEEEVPPGELEGQGLALWRVLGREPMHVDEIATEVGLEPHRSLASLLALEIRGHARQLPGMRFVRA
jgi:DNA processing protein